MGDIFSYYVYDKDYVDVVGGVAWWLKGSAAIVEDPSLLLTPTLGGTRRPVRLALSPAPGIGKCGCA